MDTVSCNRKVMRIETSLQRAKETREDVVVVSEDVDVLCILLHNTISAEESSNVFMRRSFGQISVIHIQSLQSSMGFITSNILFIHGASGCDVIESYYRKGKSMAFKVLLKDKSLAEKMTLFNEKNADPDALADLGEAFLLKLYGARKGNECINELRYIKFNQISARLALNKDFDIAVLPPTKAALRQHFLRVYYQVQEWIGNKLNRLEWGWISKNSMLVPNTGVLEVAPEFIMNLIFCNCDKSMCKTMCSCRRFGLKCTTLCGHCCGMFCINIETDEEIMDVDETECVTEE